MTKRMNITQKATQAGSLMIEAMAMLALISLVTPTLYKKSAERTTELQDINTATHMRTLIKAVDNYVADNYDTLTASIGDKSSIKLDASALTQYLPNGFNVNETLKNFGAPTISLYRNGQAVTSYVELPGTLDLGAMRASRIASIIGSNGGYVNSDNGVDGVGGSWTLSADNRSNLGFSGSTNSVVVTSTEAVTSATSNALENDKYLQRTDAGAGQKWRNTMATDLYMGGIADENGQTSGMRDILGINRLIVGATTGADANDGLYIAGEKDAYIGGSLEAIGGNFVVDGGASSPHLALTDVLEADADKVTVYGGDGLTVDSEGKLTTNYETTVDNKLTATGDTVVASSDASTFKAGENGKYITGDGDTVTLHGDKVTVTDASTKVTNTALFGGQVEVGGTDGTFNNNPNTGVNLTDLKLQVDGSTYVKNTLYADTVKTPNLEILNIHAGAKDFKTEKENRWFHATKDGVSVYNATNNKNQLSIDNNGTKLASQGEAAYLKLTEESDVGTALLYGTQIDIRASGTVDIDQGRLKVAPDGTTQGSVTVGNWSDFSVKDYEKNDKTDIFSVTQKRSDSTAVASNAVTTTVKPKTADGYFNVQDTSGTDILKVVPNQSNTSNTSLVTIDQNSFRITEEKIEEDQATPRIFEVAAVDEPDATVSHNNNRGSVYIRKGAISVEPSSKTGYAGNTGYGYVEASRFVANNLDTENNAVTPKYAKDTRQWAGTGSKASSDAESAGVNPDVYMVNPAYTSVMHDIKLTTRGGARLSDILPDFINKGIYVVNNTFEDKGGDPMTMEMTDSGSSTDTNYWASAYLGTVPAPQCPPGYARVITLTPAGFMMGQAGELVKRTYNSDTRLEVAFNNPSAVTGFPEDTSENQLQAPEFQSASLGTDTTTYQVLYANNNTSPYAPKPLYFQQSTWLKSKIASRYKMQDCDSDTPVNDKEADCSESFYGWNAIMGFIYPYGWYGDIIDALKKYGNVKTALTSTDDNAGTVYWNIFPVRPYTLEAYATIYCYFDRTNIYNSGQNSTMVDQYDYLNRPRTGSEKKGDNYDGNTNSEYINRLNDPTLKYKAVW